ncbi:MAG: hypothetical protein V3R80_00865, partial [Candidatus Tectomicrobia bacterium]
MAFQDAPSPPMSPELYRQCQRAMHVLLPTGHLLRAERACLYILQTLGYHRTARFLGLWPWRWFVAAGYFVVARYR